KLFITNGSQADFVTLLTRTSDKPGYHSYSLFVVPTNLPGFHVSRKLDKLGRRCSDTAELFFEDMRVPAENLIGEENEGFIIQMKQFQHERFYSLPANYVGARDTIDMTVDYIKQRMAFGKPLIENQVLRHRLVDWITQIECLKQLTYHIVRMKMEGLNATKEISMGKVLAGELGFTVANGCLQMFGGMGYINESLITRNFRDTRLTSIGGGATEVMKDVIARIEGF
ncbi:MAG: acyl-CoA/acyl-ACP dehydrogenase, partial [Deltaproteobacteria bacterium]|nr:acyl-CoA/acyl-ACP dehydrogenase [Deltaproteobacteria bacterium]